MIAPMRVALILVAILGCSNRSADRIGGPSKEPVAQMPVAAEAPAPEPPAAPPTEEAAAPAPPPPPPAGEGIVAGGKVDEETAVPTRGAESKRRGIDEARAAGVLGPTDRAVFEVRGKVTLESTMKAADEALRPKLDAVQACYQKILAFEENLAGTLTLQVNAGKLAVVRTTLKHADLEKCVLDALATATLPTVGKATITLAFARE